MSNVQAPVFSRAGGGPASVSKNFLAAISSSGPGLPSRVILHGNEGVGKTSWAAHAPGVVFLQSRGETGLDTLIDSGRVPETPHFPEAQSWEEALGMIASLRGEHSFKTLVLDTGNGLEKLCLEHTRRVFFSDDHEKFSSYQKGRDVAANQWRELLTMLDEIRAARRMSVIMLAHTKIRTFANPEGADYDRYEVDMGKETWGLTLRWADMCLFANSVTATSKATSSDNKAIGKGGRDRVIYTERAAAWDAKNRHGLPPMIQMGSSGAEAWRNFTAAIKAAKPQPPAKPAAAEPATAEATT